MRNTQYYSVFLVSIPIALFFSFFFLSSASAAAAPAVSPTITETRITTNPSNSQIPAIYGNNVVWQDDRNGNWDIYILDLSTKKQTHTTNKSDQLNPDIDGSKVVWEDLRNGGHDVYLQDLSTKKQTRITTSGKAIRPRIQGNRIVWMDGRNGGNLDESNWPIGNWDIYMYDIAASKEYQITSNQSMQRNPDIYGNRIVWQDEYIEGNNYKSNIYMYDVSAKKETLVSKSGYENYNPFIHSDYITWQVEDETGLYIIGTYRISTFTEKIIYTDGGVASSPAVYYERIVWTDGREAWGGSGNYDIFMHNLSTSTETQIATNESTQSNPAIYGNRIVWQDDRNGHWDIYMATLSYLPVASFSASPVSGKTPLKVQFTDKSTGAPTSWKWSFGDKTYSTQKNPKHKYSKAGKYTVSLTVKNSVGSNTKTVPSYIVVRK